MGQGQQDAAQSLWRPALIRPLTWSFLALLAASLAVSGAARAAPPRGGPDLAACPATPKGPEEGIARTRPLPVPAAMRNIVRASRDWFAVLTLTGATTCVTTRAKSSAEKLRLDRQARFFSFTWYGYEEDGHIVVDRAGKGTTIETGAPPVFSPSGKLLAAVQQSGAGWGGLEGMAIWRVLPDRTEQVTLFSDIPEMADWRIDGWSGETCIDLSAVPNERMPESGTDLTGVPRDRYVAVWARSHWQFTRHDKGCATR
ncbi:hypothetical protein [Novosphingobium album (ex Liu et al. 2023)]|uniref:Uncharacterized protein n=1 Tax=Novosphingobium album (ex Liu et al. 2023) TaxID=3031130 RepID=A0ABT5WLW3_9SPHN|nr:hypothetical protein [Novosphingobium album (ex Liu et al. 2023)]MDE8650864.1 hypothetical protein [Novosphingobium album (ex Liu et al. 2023)]